VAAAIGMAIGTGNYVLALVTLVFVLITLVVLSKLEEKLNSFHKVKQYEISFYIEQYSLEKLEAMFTKLKVSFLRYRFTRNDKLVTAYYKIEANQDEYEQLMRFLMETREISKFQS
jgi:putative Mg2+ transporter-C (MgtC) family protein